jgi:hypothetical protein
LCRGPPHKQKDGHRLFIARRSLIADLRKIS